jgi:hypothetical protein
MSSMMYRWIFIPLVQRELDFYVITHNMSKPHAVRGDPNPKDIRMVLFQRPDLVSEVDFKVSCVPKNSLYINLIKSMFATIKIEVDPELVRCVEGVYGQPNHPVHQLVPPAFESVAKEIERRLDLGPLSECRWPEAWQRYHDMRDAYYELTEQMNAEEVKAMEQLMTLAARRQWHEYEEVRPHLALPRLPDFRNGPSGRDRPFSALFIRPEDITVHMTPEELAQARQNELDARNIVVPGNRPLLVYIEDDDEEAGDGF